MLMTVGMRNNAHSLNSQERIGESLLLGHYKNGKFNFGCKHGVLLKQKVIVDV